MKTPQRKIVAGVLLIGVSLWALAFVGHAQTTTPAAKPATGAAATTPAPMDAEKAALWNSPNMLRARAWLQEYCNTSAKCKPGDAEKYMTELENMSTTQMKMWLMKFDEEEEEKQQQTQFWKHVQSGAVAHAKSVNAATRKSYAAIETEETAAANQEQGRLNYEQNLEDSEGAVKQLDAGDAYNPGLGYYPGDGVHFHFHVSD